jgi:hypothetical protein
VKTCTKCGVAKPGTEFYTNGRRLDGSAVFRPDCKDCSRKRSRESRNLEWEQRSWASRKYGLTLEEANAYWFAERCAICGTTDPKDRRRKFHIDHCHTTGKVRGALCANCNTGLGYFKDSPEVMRKAAEYIEGSRCLNP